MRHGLRARFYIGGSGLRRFTTRILCTVGGAGLLAGGIAVVTPAVPAVAGVTGAVGTTVNEAVDGSGHCANGNPNVNCNLYDGKQFVWLTGLPKPASLGDGKYFFAVLVPGGQGGNNNPNDATPLNLSDATLAPDSAGTNSDGSTRPSGDAYTNRTFTISGGTITYTGSHNFDSNKIRLMPYDDTTNPGGVYVMAVCSLDGALNPGSFGLPGVDPRDCKYDNFKVQAGASCAPNCPGPGTAHDPFVLKDAAGAYTDTYTWTVSKGVDKTFIQKTGGSATFNYTITATDNGGTISSVKVTGGIQIFNPNVDSDNNTVPVKIASVSDQLSDGTNCTVSNAGPLTLGSTETDLTYGCLLAAVPLNELDNTVTINWSGQVLSNGDLLCYVPDPNNPGEFIPNPSMCSTNDLFPGIVFTAANVDNCVTVTDLWTSTSTTTTLGVGCADGSWTTDNTLAGFGESFTTPTFTLTYARSIPVPTNTCQSFMNTATLVTNTNGYGPTNGPQSVTVTVCGPLTGGLTMGFWQNKNGQSIISRGASTAGVCNSGTWLRSFNNGPFKDLSSTATCGSVGSTINSTVVGYVYNVIKAAQCTSTSKTCNSMLKAQMLALALNVYFSGSTDGNGNALGGNQIGAPTWLGAVKVDLTQICNMIDGSGGIATCSGTFQDVSSFAFGGNKCLAIFTAFSNSPTSVLTYEASQSISDGSTWYGNVKAVQVAAKNTDDAINNSTATNPIALTCP